jgi:hypothetical protein
MYLTSKLEITENYSEYICALLFAVYTNNNSSTFHMCIYCVLLLRPPVLFHIFLCYFHD